MSKSLRLSEQWFRVGLWIVAFLFAGFLIGLGGAVVRNLPKVERVYTTDDFINKPAANQARSEINAAQQKLLEINDQMERAQLSYEAAKANSKTAHDSFMNWIATRRATSLADQDPALIARNQEVDKVKLAERNALAQVEELQRIQVNENQKIAHTQTRLFSLQNAANELLIDQQRKQELRVFLYRLAITLPLLIIAGWLVAKKRKSAYWPFVWGFALFALFTFFVELVPYLPSYGGYVRNSVGIILTALVGWQVIKALNRYLEKQKREEQLPEQQRRQELSYDIALARMSKNVCPSCERAVDLKNTANDFCQHCGICLFNKCANCGTRKNAFTKFCHACGAPSKPS